MVGQYRGHGQVKVTVTCSCLETGSAGIVVSTK